MSSFIGHSLIGATLFARQHKIDSARAKFCCFLMVGLAVSPDMDYLLRWFFHIHLKPRYTHSLSYCLVVSSFAWGLNAIVFRQLKSPLTTTLLFLAPLSHLVLDLMVGVYPMPLFWAFSSQLIVLPFGILPSAGKLSLTNYYFWRNLGIEMGILIPFVIFIIPRARETLLGNSRSRQIILLALFIGFVSIGLQLNR